MAKYSRADIVARAEGLAKLISQSEEVVLYKQAEKEIHANDKVKSAIADIKLLQKQAVNLQHYGKHEALKQTEAKIAALEEALDSIPVVSDFKESQVEVNDFLQTVTSTITKVIEVALDDSKKN